MNRRIVVLSNLRCGSVDGVDGADFAAFAIVTLGHERGAATANLQAPVVLHGPSRTGRQVVLNDGHQRVRVPLAFG